MLAAITCLGYDCSCDDVHETEISMETYPQGPQHFTFNTHFLSTTRYNI